MLRTVCETRISNKCTTLDLHVSQTPLQRDRTEVTLDRTEVTLDRTEVTLDRTEVTSDRTEVTLDFTEVTSDRTEVTLDRTEVTSDRTEVTLDFPLHAFEHCKLTISIFIPTLFCPHPIFHPLTSSRRIYLLRVKVKLTMNRALHANHMAQRAGVERQLSQLP